MRSMKTAVLGMVATGLIGVPVGFVLSIDTAAPVRADGCGNGFVWGTGGGGCNWTNPDGSQGGCLNISILGIGGGGCLPVVVPPPPPPPPPPAP